MKAFNLEQALRGYPVINRKGEKVDSVTIIEGVADNMECILTVQDGDIYEYYKNGIYYHDKESMMDLFMSDEQIETFTPQEGDLIYVKDNHSSDWQKREFIYTTKEGKHLCKSTNIFAETSDIFTINWDMIKPIEEIIELSVKIDGVEVNPNSLTEEVWLQLRK